MAKYIYKGPVTSFGICIDNCWTGETIAPTESKARSNFIYQYKKEHRRALSAKIELRGEIKLVE